MLRKFLLSSVATVGMMASAAAADLPTEKGPPAYAPPPPPAFSWTGFYVGGHVGGAWDTGAVTDVDAYAAGATPGTVTPLRASGVFGGGQAGFNWQTGPLVVGIEGDGGYLGLSDSTPLTGTASGTRVGENAGAYGDITGRLGFAFDRVLIYAKGGWAFLNDIPSFSTVSGSFSSRTSPGVSSGPTVGGGIEYAITPNWSVKVEYQYFDFDHANYTVLSGGGTPFRFLQHRQINAVELGLNYRFDWLNPAPAPVIAKY
jgi:outer membrane immunogenic protein